MLFVIRIWSVLILFLVVGNSFYSAAKSPKHFDQEIGINEFRQAEQRLGEAGDWAGPIDIYLNSLTPTSQSWTFRREGVEYLIDLPSSSWRVVSRVDVHEHEEFVNDNNELNGYLRLSKILVDVDTTAANLFQEDEKWHLRHLPGYVVCSACNGEAFRGHLNGVTFSYEYTSSGSRMAGRVYYLQVDKRTFYALRFTVAQAKLQSIREQMDFISRSFRLR